MAIVSNAVRLPRGGGPSTSSGQDRDTRGHSANLTEAGIPNKLGAIMSRYVIETESVVRPEWIDSNGHMNLAYYVVVFDLATDALYARLNIGDAYREATGFSCFTAETHTLYEREVHLGDKLRVHEAGYWAPTPSACITSTRCSMPTAASARPCRN